MANGKFEEYSRTSFDHNLKNAFTPKANQYLNKSILKLAKLIHMPSLYNISPLKYDFLGMKKDIVPKLNKIVREEGDNSIKKMMSRFKLIIVNLNFSSVIESKYIRYKIDEFIENPSIRQDHMFVIDEIIEFSTKMKKIYLDRDMHKYLKVFFNETLNSLKVAEMVDSGIAELKNQDKIVVTS